MHKILTLIAGIGCLISLPSAAQQLFDPSTVNYKPAPLTNEISETPTSQIVTPNTGLFPELEQTQPTTQATSQPAAQSAARTQTRRSGAMQLILDDVEILNPPAGLALCMGKLRLQNDTDTTLQNLSLDITFGTIPLSVQFSNVAPGASQEQNAALAGPSCNQLLGAPKLDIKTCVVPGMSLNDCKAQIKYVPIANAR